MARKESSGKLFLLLVFIIILLFLLVLYFIDLQKVEKTAERKFPSEEPVNIPAAALELEAVRKQREFSFPVSDKPELVKVLHKAYSLGYSETHEQAAWVSYLLSRRHQQNSFERRNNFKEDPLLKAGSASPEDYSHSGFDRGHLAPAGDMDFNREVLAESFFMSNISPQDPSFNRGGWSELEELVRNWATKEDSLLVVTGPVLQEGLKKIGKNKVSVPDYFYKIILDARQPEIKAIGFLMPNESIEGKTEDFVVPVDSIEALTGLDFFPLIPDLLENSLEKSVQKEKWF